MFYLLIVTIVSDGIWLLYSLVNWREDPHQQLYQAAQITSLINLVYKMALVGYLIYSDYHCRYAITLQGLADNIKILHKGVQP